MAAMSFFEKLRRAVRDALPPALGMCLTLRANPLLGLAFLIFRRRFHLGGMEFEVPLEGESWSALATYWFDDYEAPEREFCALLIRPGDRVCELGGCLGIVSMTINRRLAAPEGHVVLEANAKLVPFLERNRERNGGRFTVLHAAIGDGNPVALDFTQGVLTSTRADGGDAKRLEVVRSRTLEQLCAERGPFDVLVMDVEGAEQQVILGEGQAWRGMRLIILEWHPPLIGMEMIERGRRALEGAGFECVASRQGDLHIVEAWEKAGT